MEKEIQRLNPNDTGLYSNVPLGPTQFRIKNKSDLQHGWDIQYTSLLKTFLKNVKAPYVVYMGVNNIEYLHNAIMTTKIVKLVNKIGINIYLAETLSTYDIRNYKDKLFVDYENTEIQYIRARELDSISQYVKNNNLTNVNVYTPNYGIETVFNTAYPLLNLSCLPIGWIYPATLQLPNISTDYYTNNITKHFWCGNWKYTSHRHLVASYLAEKHLDSTNLSWIYESSDIILKDNIWFDINKLKTHKDTILAGASKLHNLAPLAMNINIDTKLSLNEVIHIHTNTNPAEYYKESFCAIVTETRFAESTGFLTEKIMNAIINYRPFIMVGPPGNLKYMKRWGFATYGEFWDESYDDETCHYKRIEKIFDLIDYISSMSVVQLKKLHKEMETTLIYNYNHILNLQEELLAESVINNTAFKRIQYAH
tara:strand:+ start:22545 stop:23816 length:1272 start_codon:yes stop_codon:yes gene_type:complete